MWIKSKASESPQQTNEKYRVFEEIDRDPVKYFNKTVIQYLEISNYQFVKVIGRLYPIFIWKLSGNTKLSSRVSYKQRRQRPRETIILK